MSVEPPIPPELWEKTPPDVRAAITALVHALEGRIAALEARLAQDSSNSSRPPSTDPPHARRRPPRPPTGKKRGGQPGHRRHSRELVPPEQLDAIVDCMPSACLGCGQLLRGEEDPEPLRHQVTELPEIRPEVIEYRLHRLACPGCGAATRGELPTGVPRGAFGPRLQAVIAALGGAYRLSKRLIRALLAELTGTGVSTGTVCKIERAAAGALAAPVQEVHEHVRGAAALGVDETSWRQDRRRAWLWVAVAADAVAFRIARSRGADALHALVGEPIKPVIISDRFGTYARAPRRQTCWAHLRRDFRSMIDRGGGGEEIGAKLLDCSERVFEWWRRHAAGSVHRETLRGYVAGLKPMVHLLLREGAGCGCERTARVCRQLLKGEGHLWTFARAGGVEPHNNAAERAPRHGVIRRKTSGGTDSEGGSRFVERMLTAVATCRRRGRELLGFLTACMRARLDGTAAPSLLT
jgi:transposase